MLWHSSRHESLRTAAADLMHSLRVCNFAQRSLASVPEAALMRTVIMVSAPAPPLHTWLNVCTRGWNHRRTAFPPPFCGRKKIALAPFLRTKIRRASKRRKKQIRGVFCCIPITVYAVRVILLHLPRNDKYYLQVEKIKNGELDES